MSFEDFPVIDDAVLESVDLHSEIQYIFFDGARLAFDFQPASSDCKYLILLVNGYQRTRLDYRAFRKKVEKLLPNAATLALDNRCCGQTEDDGSVPLSVERMARDAGYLAKIYCKKLNLPTFSVLGISMGGMIAQVIASSMAKSVSHLFLVSTTAGGKGRVWSGSVHNASELKYVKKPVNLENIQQSMRRYFGKRFLENSPLLFDMMCKSMLKTKQQNEHKSELNEELQFYASTHFDAVALLPNISAKTYVLTGDEDKIIPPQNSDYLYKNIENSKLKVYEGAGHLLLIEEPENFVQDVCQFLRLA